MLTSYFHLLRLLFYVLYVKNPSSFCQIYLILQDKNKGRKIWASTKRTFETARCFHLYDIHKLYPHLAYIFPQRCRWREDNNCHDNTFLLIEIGQSFSVLTPAAIFNQIILCCGSCLCIARCSAASLASTYQIPIELSPQMCLEKWLILCLGKE